MTVKELIENLQDIASPYMLVEMDGLKIEGLQIVLDEAGHPYVELIPRRQS